MVISSRANIIYIIYRNIFVGWPYGGKDEGIRHVIIVAGTVGPMDSMQLKGAEKTEADRTWMLPGSIVGLLAKT